MVRHGGARRGTDRGGDAGKDLCGSSDDREGHGGLSVLGLDRGEPIRWRPVGGGRWRPGSVSHRERDGSVAIHDQTGATRSVPVQAIRVALTGPRGGREWEPLTARAGRSVQLALFEQSGPAPARQRPLRDPRVAPGKLDAASSPRLPLRGSWGQLL